MKCLRLLFISTSSCDSLTADSEPILKFFLEHKVRGQVDRLMAKQLDIPLTTSIYYHANALQSQHLGRRCLSYPSQAFQFIQEAFYFHIMRLTHDNAFRQQFESMSPLCVKLLDAVVVLAGNKRKRHDTRDVHLRAEDVHIEIQLFANGLDVFETFLVVWTGSADPNLDLVLVEEGCDFSQRANDTLESAGDLMAELASRIYFRLRWNLRW